MASYLIALDHMLAAWNEVDSKKIRNHLENALGVNVRFVDPSIDVSGIDGFEETFMKLSQRSLEQFTLELAL